MSETTSTADAGENTEQVQEGAEGFKPIGSQEELDRIVQDRLARERKKFDGFDDYKAKAEKYDGVVAELDQTKTQLSTVQGETARARVAAAKGVPEALLTGSTQEEFEAAADALIAFRGEQSSNRLLIPNEGNSPTGGKAASSWSGVIQSIDDQRAKP
ncbi:MAG: hypothetical protein ABWX92_15810 [Mycetocola sp.]